MRRPGLQAMGYLRGKLIDDMNLPRRIIPGERLRKPSR